MLQHLLERRGELKETGQKATNRLDEQVRNLPPVSGGMTLTYTV